MLIRCRAGASSAASYPGSALEYFTPFGIDYKFRRKSPTFEFVNYLRAAYGEEQPFSFKGDNFSTDSALPAVQPMQRPHPPLWMMSCDPETLEFCAANGINTGYFISVSRTEAAPRYRKFISDWSQHAHGRKPNIGYSTLVYVDETDEKALSIGLERASRADVGLLPLAEPGETFQDRLAKQRKRLKIVAWPRSAKIMTSMFDPEFMLENELALIRFSETVAKKIRKASEIGLFNTLMCELNFADLPEADLMWSIRLFGEQVIPELRNYEPF